MVTGDESQSPTGGVTNEALLEAIKGLSQRMDVMDGRIMNVEGRVSSSTSTPQPNYHATSSGHAQNTPSTISPNTLHQMFNPTLQDHAPMQQTNVDVNQAPRVALRQVQFNPDPPIQNPPIQMEEVVRQEKRDEFEGYGDDDGYDGQSNRPRGQFLGPHRGRGGRNGPIPQGGRNL